MSADKHPVNSDLYIVVWYDKKISPTYRATRKLFDCQAGRREGPIISIISQEPHAMCGPLYGVLWVRLELSV